MALQGVSSCTSTIQPDFDFNTTWVFGPTILDLLLNTTGNITGNMTSNITGNITGNMWCATYRAKCPVSANWPLQLISHCLSTVGTPFLSHSDWALLGHYRTFVLPHRELHSNPTHMQHTLTRTQAKPSCTVTLAAPHNAGGTAQAHFQGA